MPVYKIRLSRAKAETLQAKLRCHYRSGKGLLPLAIQAARDYLIVLDELNPDRHESIPQRPGGLFRRFLSKDT